MFARTCMYALVAVTAFAVDAHSQIGSLSLADALALAREKAPAVVAARGELARARAEVIAASMRLDNPEIDGSAGPRFADGAERQFDFGAGISQQFESGRRRRARIAAANEGVASAEASVMVAQREVLRDASLAFFDARFLQRQQALLLDAIIVQGEGPAAIRREGGSRRIARVAREVGIDEVHAELLPADKVAAVESLVSQFEFVAMIGDGVNDAPAMGRATIGMAMGAVGSDAAIEAADVALMSDDLSRLPWLIMHSRRTMAIIRQNVVLSLGVKAVFVLLTFGGFASLWSAIAADMGVSLVVIANALRLLRFR